MLSVLEGDSCHYARCLVCPPILYILVPPQRNGFLGHVSPKWNMGRPGAAKEDEKRRCMKLPVFRSPAKNDQLLVG